MTALAKLAGMHWTSIVVVGAAVLAIATLKRIGLVPSKRARACLQQGAKVIDVRTAAEYASSHLPGTISIPLDELRDQVGRHAPDKNQPLLLHCLSGVRSGMGRRILRQMGYSRVHNLGSYKRAEKILSVS